MKNKWTLLLIGGLSAVTPALASAQTVDLTPMVVRSVTGNLHIHQSHRSAVRTSTATSPSSGSGSTSRPRRASTSEAAIRVSC